MKEKYILLRTIRQKRNIRLNFEFIFRFIDEKKIQNLSCNLYIVDYEYTFSNIRNRCTSLGKK